MAMHSGMAPGAIPASTGPRRHRHGRHLLGAGHGGLQRRRQRDVVAGADPLRRQNRADAAGAGRYRSGVARRGGLDPPRYRRARHPDLQQRELRQVPGPAGRQSWWPRLLPTEAGTATSRQRLAAGTIPQSWTSVAGEEIPLYWKGRPFQLDAGSVWTLNLPNFAGYGDPLDRDPADVARDLAEGMMSPRGSARRVRRGGGPGDRRRCRRLGGHAGDRCRAGRRKRRAVGRRCASRPAQAPRPRPSRGRDGLGDADPRGHQREPEPRPDGRRGPVSSAAAAGPGPWRDQLQRWMRGEGEPGRLDRSGLCVLRHGHDGARCASGSSSVRGVVRGWPRRSPARETPTCGISRCGCDGEEARARTIRARRDGKTDAWKGDGDVAGESGGHRHRRGEGDGPGHRASASRRKAPR